MTPWTHRESNPGLSVANALCSRYHYGPRLVSVQAGYAPASPMWFRRFFSSHLLVYYELGRLDADLCSLTMSVRGVGIEPTISRLSS